MRSDIVFVAIGAPAGVNWEANASFRQGGTAWRCDENLVGNHREMDKRRHKSRQNQTRVVLIYLAAIA